MFSEITVQVSVSTDPCFVAVKEGSKLRIVLDPFTGRQLIEAMQNASELPAQRSVQEADNA